MHDPTARRDPTPDFGRPGPEHVGPFLEIMSLLHAEPVAPAFGRLLSKKLEPGDYILLAHVFEEISVLALHHLIPEALLFDAFAFDLYWDELREDVLATRQQTGNEKFCENFEIAAERARIYRRDRPPKRRWLDRREDSDQDEPPHHHGGGQGPHDPQPGLDPTVTTPTAPAGSRRP
jgi:hypothetical protein